MYDSNADRTRVSRVRVMEGEALRVIHDCWVSIRTGASVASVWTARDAPEPLLSVPLDALVIEWPDVEVPM